MDRVQAYTSKGHVGNEERSTSPSRSRNQVLALEHREHTSPRVSLSVSALDQAVSFFFASHINEPSESCYLIYSYLPDFYTANSNAPISNIIKAIGLAGLSSFRSVPALLSSAYSFYSLALNAIVPMLQDAVLAKTDETLLTIYLLGIYEVCLLHRAKAVVYANCTQTDTGREEQSMRAWEHHIAGAAALLRIRGRDQIQSELGRRLFINLKNQLVGCESCYTDRSQLMRQ